MLLTEDLFKELRPPFSGKNFVWHDEMKQWVAERGGFEPPVPLLVVHAISSRAP